MNAYRGHPLAGHLAILRSRGFRIHPSDRGWSRFARSTEMHTLPGDHVTLITRHVAELAQVVRASIERRLERV